MTLQSSAYLLNGDEPGNVLQVLFDQFLVLEHDALPVQGRRLAPSFEGLGSRVDSRGHLILGAARHLRDNLVGGRVVHVDPVGRSRVHKLAVDDILCFSGNLVAGKAQAPRQVERKRASHLQWFWELKIDLTAVTAP